VGILGQQQGINMRKNKFTTQERELIFYTLYRTIDEVLTTEEMENFRVSLFKMKPKRMSLHTFHQKLFDLDFVNIILREDGGWGIMYKGMFA
jgi:hypothetical protein